MIFNTNKINVNYFLYATVAMNLNMFHENEAGSSLMQNKYNNIDQTVFFYMNHIGFQFLLRKQNLIEASLSVM